MDKKSLQEFQKFLTAVSEELKGAKKQDVVTESFEPTSEMPTESMSTVDQLANYISRSQKREKAQAPLNDLTNQLVEQPNIEQQRWNDPLLPLDQKFVTVKDMNDHYNLFLKRIQQQMASIGGGGEVKFARLDDVDSFSAGYNKFLTFDPIENNFKFNTIGVGNGIELDDSDNVSLSVASTNSLGGIKIGEGLAMNLSNQAEVSLATEATIGGIRLGPGVELNGLGQLIIDSGGLDFSFGDFFAYVANGASETPAAYLSSINENQDIIIQSNGTGQIDIIGRFGIYPVDGPLSLRDPVFSVNDDGDVSATTLNVKNTSDLGLVAPLNVTINEQGLTKTPAVVSGSVAQFTGRDNRSSIMILDTYGIDSTRSITGGEFVFRTGRGTNQTPSAVQKNDILGNLTAAGWASNGYGGVGVGGIKILADENFTSTARGSRVEIYCTPNGTITPTRTLTVDQTGIVFNDNDTTGISNVDYISFDPNHVDTANAEGVIAWSSTDNTLNIHHPNNVTQQVGQELFAYVRNRTGSTITNGSAVRFSGAEQNGKARLLVTPFLGNGTYPNLYGLGITTQDIADGEDGFVTVWGLIRQINTSAWNVGDILYVSPTSAGGLTNVKPTAPNNVIPIAAVLRKDATQGEIFVRPTIEQKAPYGSFSDNQPHTAALPNTPYAIPLNTTEFSNGVFRDPNDATKIRVDQSGLYNFQFSTQFVSSNSSAKDVYIWPRKNTNDVPNSASRLTIVGNGVYTIASWNFIISMNAGDSFQLMWATTNTSASITAPQATSFAPATPSTLLSVTLVAQ